MARRLLTIPIVLSRENVSEIKYRLWHGEPASALVAEFQTAQSHILSIMRGHRWSEIRWPNNHPGKLPVKQREKITLARKEAMPFYYEQVKRLLKSDRYSSGIRHGRKETE